MNTPGTDTGLILLAANVIAAYGYAKRPRDNIVLIIIMMINICTATSKCTKNVQKKQILFDECCWGAISSSEAYMCHMKRQYCCDCGNRNKLSCR